MNRRALKSNVFMTVNDITFLPASGTDWAAADEVVFAGTLEEAMIMAVKNFAVLSNLIQEDYKVVWERNWTNMLAYPITAVSLLGAVHVTPDEVDLVGMVTNNYRYEFTSQTGLVLELVADPTVKLFYHGSLAAILAYLLQVDTVGTPSRVYELYNFSLFDLSKGVGYASGFVDILGTLGPVEIEKAHETLVNSFANANILR